MIVRPFFGRPQSDDANQDVFVLMPFEDELRPVYDDHIAKVAGGMGLTVARADDFAATSAVMQQVWSGICNCRLIIADCTRRNANVFYEIGVAHTIGKPVILITQNRAHIPFDIGHIRYIHYEFTPRGMTKFEAKLASAIQTVVKVESGRPHDA